MHHLLSRTKGLCILATVMSTYLERWHAAKVILIGYSFGADVLPFAYNRLPQELRRHVGLMALLGPEKRVNFQITVSGWLNLPPGDDAVPIAPPPPVTRATRSGTSGAVQRAMFGP